MSEQQSSADSAESEHTRNLANALRMQEAAEESHANCDECDGEDDPVTCSKCFPLFDEARIERRRLLSALNVPQTAPELTATCQKLLPGGIIDDATYAEIEDALDRADAPATVGGRWLKLHERIAALTAERPAASAEPQSQEGGGEYVKLANEHLARCMDENQALLARIEELTCPHSQAEIAEDDGPLKFADYVENIAASFDNPIKYGRFVRIVDRTGRLNAGKFVEYIDDRGETHLTPPDNIRRRDRTALSRPERA